MANQEYALLVPSLTTLPATDLRQVVGNHTDAREQILAAVVIDPASADRVAWRSALVSDADSAD